MVAIAVIAGVGPGLGFSLAKKFSGEYKVVLLSRNQEKLNGLALEITKNGGEVFFLALDLMISTDFRQLESRRIWTTKSLLRMYFPPAPYSIDDI